MIEFYKRIDSLLKEKKSTQKELSNYLGLSSFQVYSNWKQRDSIPSADTAVKIAEFLDTTVEYLITGVDTNPLADQCVDLKNRLNKIRDFVNDQTLSR